VIQYGDDGSRRTYLSSRDGAKQAVSLRRPSKAAQSVERLPLAQLQRCLVSLAFCRGGWKGTIVRDESLITFRPLRTRYTDTSGRAASRKLDFDPEESIDERLAGGRDMVTVIAKKLSRTIDESAGGRGDWKKLTVIVLG